MSEAEVPPYSKAILNANRGVTNIIEADVIRDDLIKVIDKLFNTLKKHYGPLSEFAALDSRDPLSKTKFTKDGINIVRAIEFTSPQEDWIRKTVAFIGERVEASVGDGTTSAMMFTCAMMKRMMQSIDKLRPISYIELQQKFMNLVYDIEDNIKLVTYGPKVDGEVDSNRVHQIVYNQVYTASHGDVELAKAVAELYDSTPEELWDKMIYERLTYESDKRFDVVYTGGQYQMPCEVMMNGMLNQEFCSRYDHEHCTFVVMNNPIMMDTDAYQYVIDTIESDEVSKDKPLVILCHSNIDTATYQDLIARLNEYVTRDKPVVIFYVNTTMGDWNPEVNDFRTLQLLCGMEITKLRRTQNRNELVIVKDVHVSWTNKTLVLDHLYEVPEEWKDEPRRHMAIDGKHMQYTDYLAAVKKYAEAYAKLPANKSNKEMTTLMYRTYAKLMYTKLGCIRIGGSVHDNVALLDIVDDCVRASSRALCKGITFGNNRSLYIILKEFEDIEKYDRVRSWLISNMIAALEDMAVAQMELIFPGEKFSKRRKRQFVETWYTHAINVIGLFDKLHDDDADQFDPLVDLSETNLVNKLADALVSTMDFQELLTDPLITQPADTDISMLKRFGEVALKFALSGRIIVSNSAYVNDNERKAGKK